MGHSINRRSSPVHLASTATEDSPFFLPNGELVFRAIEGGSNFLYRMKGDGSDRRKIIPGRILKSTLCHRMVVGSLRHRQAPEKRMPR